jgi:soluble lytic murein transglycosylase-like protein
MIKNTNAFWGGLPDFARLNPRVRTALRTLFLAPDWEWSLLKQLMGGVLGLDEERVRYMYNVFAFNMFLNSAINASRGIRPDTTDWRRVYEAVQNNDVGRLFRQTLIIAGIPVNVDLLGYESEFWKQFYSAFEPIIQAGGITKGSLILALKNFGYHLSTKASIPIQETVSTYNYISSQNRQNESFLEALLKPFFPYIAKGFFFPQDKANWIASGLASVISGGTGTRTQVLTKTQPLVQMIVSDQPYSIKTYKGISQYIDTYKKELEKIHKNPNQSYSQNFYSTLLNQGGLYEAIPMYKEYLNQYKATNDAKEKQIIANKIQEYTDRSAAQLYETIRHGLYYKIIRYQMGEKKANEYIAKIVSDTMNYAYMRARQQSTKDQKSQIFPNEENQQPTQTQQQQPQPQSSQDIGTIIKKASHTYGVPEKLIRAVIQAESSGNPNAVSPKGAVGLMQLEPSTAQELGVTDINDPQQNIMGGAKYLSFLIKKYNGDFVLALAAYNAGPNAVDQYGGVPPIEETIDYINRVADIYNNT